MKQTYLRISVATLLAAPAIALAQPGPVGGVPPLAVTEIMYNPPESGNDSLEFVEIYNNNPNTVALGGMTFTSGITYTFPLNATLAGNSYVMIAGDSLKFNAFYGQVAYQWTGGTTQLSNTGEALVLKTSTGETVDSVFYDDAVAWPQLANGQGTSLVVCSPTVDNSLAASWYAASTPTGGIVNSVPVFANPGSADPCLGVGVRETKNDRFDVYPNPTYDKVTLTNPADVQVYDMTGQLKASYKMVREVNLINYAPGLYVFRTSKGEMVRVIKK